MREPTHIIARYFGAPIAEFKDLELECENEEKSSEKADDNKESIELEKELNEKCKEDINPQQEEQRKPEQITTNEINIIIVNPEKQGVTR